MEVSQLRLFFITLCMVGIISACTDQESAGDDSSLVGTIWNLNALNSGELVPFNSIKAEFFEKGIVAGSAGCNNYTAAYEVDGENITFNMSPAATTRRACPEPIMDQENDYLAALASVSTFSVSEDELALNDSSDTVVAVYSAVSQDLADTSWIVVGYNNGTGGVVSVQADTSITASFGGDGQLTGNASCNDYFGPHETDVNNIAMGPFGTTRKLCPDPIMDQENQYLAALETAVTYKFDGITLNMRTADDATAVNLKPAATVTGMVTNEDNAPFPKEQLQPSSLRTRL